MYFPTPSTFSSGIDQMLLICQWAKLDRFHYFNLSVVPLASDHFPCFPIISFPCVTVRLGLNSGIPAVLCWEVNLGWLRCKDVANFELIPCLLLPWGFLSVSASHFVWWGFFPAFLGSCQGICIVEWEEQPHPHSPSMTEDLRSLEWELLQGGLVWGW